VLVHMFAQVSGLQVGELVHVIANAHIYDKHIDTINEIKQNKQYKAPKLEIDPNITNFYDFTVDSFKLVDYEFNKNKDKIEIAI